MDDRSFNLRRRQVTNRGNIGLFQFFMYFHHPNNRFEKKMLFSFAPLQLSPPQKNYSQDEKNIEEAYSPLAPPSYAFAKKHMHTMCGQNAKVLSICQTWLYSTYTKPLCFKDLNGFLNYGRNLLAL